MMSDLRAVPIAKDVYWVGAIDWGLRDFHGYENDRGSTYNAYLVLSEIPTLIDTVKAPFFDELVSRISSVIDPGRIRYVISNHSEMDHSGCLPRIIDLVKPEKVFASTMGQKALEAHFRIGDRVTAVRDGDKISLGDRDAVFVETRMLHWPDSMFTYLPAERILFSNDGFGMHLASSERFADELDPAILMEEAKKYFANILLPYSGQVTALFGKVEKSGLNISLIAPDHGPVWRREGDVRGILESWRKWALQEPSPRAVITYDTMWGSTEMMARTIADGLSSGKIDVEVYPLKASPRSDVATAVLGAAALIVGSPTLNNEMFPTVADVLAYLKGLRPKNLIGASFGSYGWSGESVGLIEAALAEMKTNPVGENVRLQYVPDAEGFAACRKFGEMIAEKITRDLGR
jgi:flavorubredoxin